MSKWDTDVSGDVCKYPRAWWDGRSSPFGRPPSMGRRLAPASERNLVGFRGRRARGQGVGSPGAWCEACSQPAGGHVPAVSSRGKERSWGPYQGRNASYRASNLVSQPPPKPASGIPPWKSSFNIQIGVGGEDQQFSPQQTPGPGDGVVWTPRLCPARDPSAAAHTRQLSHTWRLEASRSPLDTLRAPAGRHAGPHGG